MQWWTEFLNWLNSSDGGRIVSTIVIPFVAIVVAGLVAATIGRASARKVIELSEREVRASAVTALISAARKAAVWNSLATPEQQHIDHLISDAEIRLRLLPVAGTSMAADWASHEIAGMKRNAVSFSFQAEQSLLVFRDRLIEWQGRPGRAKKLFRNDLESWSYDSSVSEQELVHQQQAWAAGQVSASQATASQATASQDAASQDAAEHDSAAQSTATQGTATQRPVDQSPVDQSPVDLRPAAAFNATRPGTVAPTALLPQVAVVAEAAVIAEATAVAEPAVVVEAAAPADTAVVPESDATPTPLVPSRFDSSATVAPTAAVEPQQVDAQLVEPAQVDAQQVDAQLVEPELVEPELVEPQQASGHSIHDSGAILRSTEFSFGDEADEPTAYLANDQADDSATGHSHSDDSASANSAEQPSTKAHETNTEAERERSGS